MIFINRYRIVQVLAGGVSSTGYQISWTVHLRLLSLQRQSLDRFGTLKSMEGSKEETATFIQGFQKLTAREVDWLQSVSFPNYNPASATSTSVSIFVCLGTRFTDILKRDCWLHTGIFFSILERWSIENLTRVIGECLSLELSAHLSIRCSAIFNQCWNRSSNEYWGGNQQEICEGFVSVGAKYFPAVLKISICGLRRRCMERVDLPLTTWIDSLSPRMQRLLSSIQEIEVALCSQ